MAINRNELRILVVDDARTMRAVVKQTLRKEGFTLLDEAASGNEAYMKLIEASDRGTPFHLVVSDWNMPDGTGIELLKACRNDPDLKTLPFVMVTAESEMVQVKEALDLGVSNYVVKPFTPESLLKKILPVVARILGAQGKAA